MSARIRCHVLEAPAHEWNSEWNSLTRGRGVQSHREILPWADPYIAQLMQRLESRFDADEGFANAFDRSEDAPWPVHEWNGGEWNGGDAESAESFAEPFDAISSQALPAVFGGWPLLNDTLINDMPSSGMQESYDDDSL